MPSKVTPVTPEDLPEEMIDGLELVDKAALVGVPHVITEVSFETGARNVEYAYIDGYRIDDGGSFTYNDSSTGVRQQLIKHLGDRVPTDGASVRVNIRVPAGLRVSEFEVKDDRGKTKTAKTYYLTGSGKRGARSVRA